MIGRKQALAALCLGMAVPAAAQDLVFSMEATDSCLADTAHGGPARECIGQSASLCMEQSEGGSSTIGMSACLGAEGAAWDRRLNALYGRLMEREKRDDEEMRRLGTDAPQKASALRQMQRAWIAWRDARCAYIASQWGGGTGAGPAAQECRMRMTGEQALFLRRMLAER